MTEMDSNYSSHDFQHACELHMNFLTVLHFVSETRSENCFQVIISNVAIN